MHQIDIARVEAVDVHDIHLILHVKLIMRMSGEYRHVFDLIQHCDQLVVECLSGREAVILARNKSGITARWIMHKQEDARTFVAVKTVF